MTTPHPTPNTDEVWRRQLPWKLKFVLVAAATLADRRDAGVQGDWEAEFTEMTGMTEAQWRPLIKQAQREGHLLLDRTGCPEQQAAAPHRHLRLLVHSEGEEAS